MHLARAYALNRSCALIKNSPADARRWRRAQTHFRWASKAVIKMLPQHLVTVSKKKNNNNVCCYSLNKFAVNT